MTSPCVCGHVHRSPTLVWLCWCGCTIFHPDDGSEQGALSVRTESYDGFYAGKQWPA